MNKSLQGRVSKVNRSNLTPIVRKALNDVRLEVDHWQWTAMDGADDGIFGSAVYRFSGTLRDDNRSWSMILKTIREYPNQDSAHSHYWRREFEVYQSGWLDTIQGTNLEVPRCFHLEEFPGECCWLWLEDISSGQAKSWPLERFALAAYHLGQFNGRYAAEESLPGFTWLRKDWLDQEAQAVKPLINNLDTKSEHPLSDRLLSAERCQKMRQLWGEKEVFIAALNRLPQTVSHLDSFSRNLYDREGNTILIDWQLVGLAAIGADLSHVISGTLAFNDLSVSQARVLEPMILERYLAGLRDAGWHEDPRLVRLGYAAYASLHNLFRMLHVQSNLKSKTGQMRLESKGGYPIERHIEQWIEMFEFFDDQADNARRLICELDLISTVP